MKEDLERLIGLQLNDEKIVACLREEEEIPQGLGLREVKIKELEGKAELAGEELTEVGTQLKEIERQLEETKELQRKGQARLLQVKTQREHQAVQREVEVARKRRGELEAQFAEILNEKKAKEEEVKQLRVQIKEEESAYEEEKGKAGKRMKEVKGSRGEMEKDRKTAAGLIDPILLQRYDKIFRRYRGQAVVKVVRGVCYGCYMTVPPQLFNQVLARTGIHECPNCGRIIYVEDSSQS